MVLASWLHLIEEELNQMFRSMSFPSAVWAGFLEKVTYLSKLSVKRMGCCMYMSILSELGRWRL